MLIAKIALEKQFQFALVCQEGFAAGGELTVGGTSSSVGAGSRKLVRVARVAVVNGTVFMEAAKQLNTLFRYKWSEDQLFVEASKIATEHTKWTRGLKVDELVRCTQDAERGS